MAAVEVARSGRTVALVAPEKHLGGMSVEGLGSSDIDNHWFRNSDAIGGLAREFYLRAGRKYGKTGPVYKFESRVAEAVIDELLAEHRVPVHRERLLDGVRFYPGTRRLASLRTASGEVFEASVFIDATIEADLAAAAGVETVIGREANSKYGETKNGIREENTYRQFAVRVDPYRVEGKPESGVLPTIRDEPLGKPGSGDHRVQGYCFRLCLTRNPENRIAITKPEGFERSNYEIYLRYVRAGGQLFSPGANLPGGKTDLGSWHDLSANLYGMNHEYPGGSYATRKRIYDLHREFTHGLIWFLANDAELPQSLRDRWSGWGLCKDEFTDNGGWPRSIYVRDARRMVSDYVITEHHTKRINGEPVTDPIGVAFWPPDTHHVRRIVRDGAAYNEGFVFGGDDWGPFGVSYRSIVPRRSEAVNLLVPASPSSSHVAYGAIRLEWTFMILGESAGVAAVQFLEDKNAAVQDVDYPRLRKRLLARGQVVSVNLVPAK